MKKAFSAVVRTGAVILLVLLATGCDDGTANRIQEKYSYFITLTPAKQQNIINGIFEIGDTSDVVYMAIGSPAKVKTKDAPEGKVEMWTYIHTYSAPGTAKLGFNNPNSTRYTPQQVGNGMSGPIGVAKNPGVGSSTFSPLSQSLDVPDVQSNMLYVFFFNGRVTEIKLDTGN